VSTLTTRPTVSLEDVLAAAQAFNYAQHYAEVVSVAVNPDYRGSTITAVIQLQVAGHEAAVDSLAWLFDLGDDITPESGNYTRRGSFQGRTVEVYSGRSAS
jgi:hypothetical protein